LILPWRSSNRKKRLRLESSRLVVRALAARKQF